MDDEDEDDGDKEGGPDDVETVVTGMTLNSVETGTEDPEELFGEDRLPEEEDSREWL